MYYGGVFCFEKRMTSEIMQKKWNIVESFCYFCAEIFLENRDDDCRFPSF